MSEAHWASHHRCASNPHFARPENNGFMQWKMFEFVIFAAEHAEQDAVIKGLHADPPF
jgi:hypothetical protein